MRRFDPLTIFLLYMIVVSTSFVLQVRAVDEHDVGISNVVADYGVVWAGAPSKINVTVSNYGIWNEICNVTVYANSTVHQSSYPDLYVIGVVNGINLTAGNSANVTVSWDGYSSEIHTRVPLGKYTIIAYVTAVEGEVNVSNNTLASIRTIAVTQYPDVNGDGKINVIDLLIIVTRLRGLPPLNPWNPEPWGPRIDLRPDGVINVLDLICVASSLGKVYY